MSAIETSDSSGDSVIKLTELIRNNSFHGNPTASGIKTNSGQIK